MTAIHWNAYRVIDAQLRGIPVRCGAHRGGLDAAAALVPRGSRRGRPTAGGERRAVPECGRLHRGRAPDRDLANWQADRDGLFPVRFRPQLNPFSHLGQTLGERPLHSSSLLLEPPVVDFSATRNGREVASTTSCSGDFRRTPRRKTTPHVPSSDSSPPATSRCTSLRRPGWRGCIAAAASESARAVFGGTGCPG